jgi:hypothetical protein
MRNTTVGLRAVAALLLGSIALLADNKSEAITSTNMFGVFAGWFGTSVFTQANIDEGMLGLQKLDDVHWRMSDFYGTVQVVADPNRGFFSVTYHPKIRVSLGDAAIAALIAKAESIEFGNTAEELVLTISKGSLSDGEHKGTRTELLTIGLGGGVLEEAKVISVWK